MANGGASAGAARYSLRASITSVANSFSASTISAPMFRSAIRNAASARSRGWLVLSRARSPVRTCRYNVCVNDAQEQLITSTQELLWERGYVGTSPKAIQQRAGVGQGSMYHHFNGKSDLAAAAVRRSSDELIADVASVLDGPGKPLDRISAYLLREREILRGCRIGGLTQDPDVVASEGLRGPVKETFLWLRRRLAEVVGEAQASGELAAGIAPEEVASMICAVLQGGYVIARAENSTKPFSEAVAGAISLLRGFATSASVTPRPKAQRPARRKS